MWRPSLKSLPPIWGKVAILIAVFVLGALFNQYLMPWISRDVDVYEIRGVKGAGCTGFWGATFVRFGGPRGQSDGIYEVPCGEFVVPSDTVQLHCSCR